MLQRSTDGRLSRSTRQSLVFSIVVDSLHSLREKKKPAIQYRDTQQMLRSVDDDVRAHAADVLQQFVRELSVQERPSPEKLFDRAIAPFLAKVWPQERSLATSGVSRALADLPATTRLRFAEAVDSISRFLVPFDAWSSMEYGLYGEDDEGPKLQAINSERTACALLRLLDATVGIAEGSVVPHDLSEMLGHIQKVSTKVAQAPAFRRLSAAARI
jgi:hypothetical protein